MGDPGHNIFIIIGLAMVAMIAFAAGLNLGDPTDGASPSETFRNYLLGFGVLGAGYGLYLAAIRTTALRQQAQTQAEEAEARSVSETRRHVTETFATGVELLGRESEQHQISGIYTLGRLTADDRGMFDQVAAVLSSYVRTQCPMPADQENQSGARIPGNIPIVSNGVRAALQTMADLEHRDAHDPSRIDLSGAAINSFSIKNGDLAGANLEGARFENGTFVHTKINSAFISDTAFQNCSFFWCDFQHTQFTRTTLTRCSFAACSFVASMTIHWNLRNWFRPPNSFFSCDFGGAGIARDFPQTTQDCRFTGAFYLEIGQQLDPDNLDYVEPPEPDA